MMCKTFNHVISQPMLHKQYCFLVVTFIPLQYICGSCIKYNLFFREYEFIDAEKSSEYWFYRLIQSSIFFVNGSLYNKCKLFVISLVIEYADVHMKLGTPIFVKTVLYLITCLILIFDIYAILDLAKKSHFNRNAEISINRELIENLDCGSIT
uniref:Uncharacterized protein n=1 Tax=Glossina pallidipes TaxID=7398 RepID=A0A1A9ZSD0_GLOPL